MGYLNQRGGDGPRVEYGNPGGFSCRHQDGERPSLSIGGGIAEANQVIPGLSIDNDNGNAIVIPSKQAKPQPVIGVVVRIPFSTVKRANCDALMAVDLAFLRLEKAKELFEQGLITKKQLQAVADAAYRVLYSGKAAGGKAADGKAADGKAADGRP